MQNQDNIFENQLFEEIQIVDDNNLQNIFNNKLQKDLFFRLAKQGKVTVKSDRLASQFQEKLQKTSSIGIKENENEVYGNRLLHKQILDYFDQANQGSSLPQPLFVLQFMKKNILNLAKTIISDNVAQAIANFLESTKNIQQCQVNTLIIDECAMSDANFATILKGISKQGNYLKSIIYQGNYFEDKSAEQIQLLMPHLLEFTLSNPLNKFLKNQMMVNLTDAIIEKGKKLQKLKFCKFSLNNNIDNICEIIINSTKLLDLDLSWCSLQPKQLFAISKALLLNPKKLRKVNFSYNCLNFRNGSPSEQQASNDFIKNFLQFLKESERLNHIDLSGMNLNGPPLITLARQFALTSYLSVVHLNDNSIMQESPKYLQELFDIFCIEKLKELPEINNFLHVNPILKNAEHIKNKVKTILKDGQSAQSSYITFTNNQLVQKNNFRNQMTKNLQIKNINTQKLTNFIDSKGPSLQNKAHVDNLTLIRKVNSPELIFNFDLQKDEYFSANAAESWQLSFNSDCYVCDFYKLTLIMYDQSVDQANNPQLIQVHDQQFIKEVQEHCLEYFRPQDLADVPLILGSVVQPDGTRQFKLCQYSRKVKMLKAEFFSLLSCCYKANFAKTQRIVNKLKDSIILFTDKRQKIVQRVLKMLLKGWEYNLINYAMNNTVYDLQTVNFPDCLRSQYQEMKNKNVKSYENKEIAKDANKITKNEDSQLYCFADYLPPGYHHFLIYDHATQRLFVKDIIVQCRQFPNIYPDQPENSQKLGPQKVNVWRPWLDDTFETDQLIYENDLSSGKYQPQRVIKNHETLQLVKQFQLANFDLYKVFYQELVSKSLSYPGISFSEIYGVFTQIIKIFGLKELPKAFFELSFQLAVRNQNTKLLKGQLCRAEMMDFLLRLAVRITPDNLYKSVNTFAVDYIKPIFENSQIILQRKIIRKSKKLNDLLWKNQGFLDIIFKQYKNGFSPRSATDLICTDLTHQQIMSQDETEIAWIPGQKLPEFRPPDNPLQKLLPCHFVQTCFSYSLMTIKNEQISSQKYNQAVYVEFLEFICRIALSLYSNTYGVYQKTKKTLEILLIRHKWSTDNFYINSNDQIKIKMDMNQYTEIQEIEGSSDEDEEQTKK